MTKRTFKLILPSIIFLLSALKVSAQDPSSESPKELLLSIQKSKPDTNRISLQVKLASYYLFKPGEYKNDLDSSLNFFNQATALSNKLHAVDWQYRILKLMGKYYTEAGDLERSKQCYMRVIAYYSQSGDFGKEADALSWIANKYADPDPGEEYKKRESFYQRAISLYMQHHQLLKAADALSGIAGIHADTKRFDLAENELKQALIQYKALGYKRLQDTYSVLYRLAYAKGNYYRAITYASEGIASMRAGKDTATDIAVDLYLGMARCNFAVKNYEATLGWLRKALVIGSYPMDLQAKLVQVLLLLDRTEEARVEFNKLRKMHPSQLSDTIAQYRAFAIYYDKINNSDMALQYYSKIFKLGKNTNHDDYYISCNNEIAGIYLKINQPAKAEKYLVNAARIFKSTKASIDPKFLVMFYDYSYKYDVATGNYRAAVKNLEQHDKIQDSLFTVDKNNKISELDIKYKTHQQEQSIKTLHIQSAEQQATLNKANLQKNITIGGILVMILISALFYRNYRQKQAANNIITHKNDLLQHLLTEKEWLLKEVHHRVKNNLHTVICLLESQAAYLKDDALKAIENGQHRIYAMSLIHQKLYQSDDIKTIDMSEYIPDLVESLEDGFDVSNQIQFKLDISSIKLDISHAIPIGLIINEAVTNSIKYAFPNNRQGEISISLLNDGDRIKLELADNGIGMPQISDAGSGSLGLELMKGLSEDIDAEISFEVDNGTKITIVFEPNALGDPDVLLKSAEKKKKLYA